jgi:hypothetical protein
MPVDNLLITLDKLFFCDIFKMMSDSSPISPLIFPSEKPKSPMIRRMIELLTDVNLTMNEIDEKMMQEFPQLIKEGWHIGSTREKVKKYPLLARTASEARVLLWRELGRSKIDGFRVISEAMEAQKATPDGVLVEDHDMRMKAADRMLTLMGEQVSPAGAKVNINMPGDSNKIVIMTSDGRELKSDEELRTTDGNKTEPIPRAISAEPEALPGADSVDSDG